MVENKLLISVSVPKNRLCWRRNYAIRKDIHNLPDILDNKLESPQGKLFSADLQFPSDLKSGILYFKSGQTQRSCSFVNPRKWDLTGYIKEFLQWLKDIWSLMVFTEWQDILFLKLWGRLKRKSFQLRKSSFNTSKSLIQILKWKSHDVDESFFAL